MKKVLSKTNSGKYIWILIPDVYIWRYLNNPKGINYLDIFYGFVKFCPTKTEIKDLIKDSMMALDNKLEQLLFLDKELFRKNQYLLKKGKHNRRIYSYRPYQHLLALLEACLNVIHSIKDLITRIDGYLGQDFYRKIIESPWFRYLMAIRNLLQHIESPLVTIEQNNIIFQFERLKKLHGYDELKKILRLPSLVDNLNFRANIPLAYIREVISNIFLPALNNWAKKHLDRLNQDFKIDVITGFKKDGSFITKKVSLRILLKIVH